MRRFDPQFCTKSRKRVREKLWLAQGELCRFSGEPTELPPPGAVRLTGGHAVLARLDREGGTERENLCVSCFACNEQRRERR